MPRIKLYLSYDGTRFNGWQRQTNTPNTIQEILETKLSLIANKRVTTRASGRTDTGVHARVQVAHADVPEHMIRLNEQKTPRLGDSRLLEGLNSMLPPDIRILRIDPVGDDFMAGRTLKKTYLYFIDPSRVQTPELRNYTWHLRFPLDWEEVVKATAMFVGRHDFKAFCGARSKVKTTTRTIYEARWGTYEWQGMSHRVPLRVLRLTGSGFLRHMVRSIAGTLVHIGNGRAKSDLIAQAIRDTDRMIVGPTAPAKGLWLWDILYP